MSDESGVEGTHRRLPAAAGVAIWMALGIAIAATLATGLLLAMLPPLPGRLGADATTGLVSVLGDLGGRLAGATTLGLLAARIAFLPVTADGTPAAGSRRLAVWTVRAGQVWLAASLLMTFANPAYLLAVKLQDSLRPDAWWTFIATTPSALAWLSSAAVALGTVLVSYREPAPSAFTLAWLAGAAATMFVAATGNVSVGLDHDWATDATAVATLAWTVLASGAIGVLAAATVSSAPLEGVRRYHRVALFLLVVAATGYTVAVWQQLAGASPFEVVFGLPVVAGFAVLALLVVNWCQRQVAYLLVAQPHRDRALSGVAVDVALLIVGTACLTAATYLPPPRFLVPQTIQVNYLGYEVDLPATIERLAGWGRPNLLWVLLSVIAIGAYAWGVVRVRTLGGHWPTSRLLFWLAGWGLTLYLAVSGLWTYSTAVFSWHMLVHMTVNMMVPVLCALGGPFGLVEAASREHVDGDLARPAGLMDGLARNRLVRIVLSPPLVWVVYVFSLFAVYFSPLFPWLMRYHWGHQVMLLHFMIAGFAFFSLVVGPDRHPWQLPYLVRFALLLSVMPFHAIFAVGIMSAHSVIGEQFYRSIGVSWVGDLLADQNNAGQITWFTGEIPAFLAVIALAAQWFRSDTSEAAVADRLADSGDNDDLAAYNDMLTELAERDRTELRPLPKGAEK